MNQCSGIETRFVVCVPYASSLHNCQSRSKSKRLINTSNRKCLLFTYMQYLCWYDWMKDHNTGENTCTNRCWWSSETVNHYLMLCLMIMIWQTSTYFRLSFWIHGLYSGFCINVNCTRIEIKIDYWNKQIERITNLSHGTFVHFCQIELK